jgi:hypothetical protein
VNSNNDRPGQEAVAVDSVMFKGEVSPVGIGCFDTPMRPTLDRALPGPMVDLIRDGVAAKEFRRRGGKAVFSALVRTAASAAQRGWDAWEWEEFVVHPASTLGRQVRLRDGVKARTAKGVRKLLDDAWESATAWLSEQPPAFSRVQMAAQAQSKADALMRKAEDPGFSLLEQDRRVLAYACDQARSRGMDRVALPWRTVAKETGLGERSTKNALQRLHDKGLLTLVERGRPGTHQPKAALYALAPVPVPVNGSVGPAAQICGTSEDNASGTPFTASPSSVGPPHVDASIDKQNKVTLTLTADSPEALERTLQLLAQERSVDVTPASSDSLVGHDNVTPLRRTRRAAS